ncbi:MAG: restriction endonuclease subunit S [Lachnospiraceae bacterium]|nr:restriction endonuclease subunit S [Lachnospiraceae bacterium]
MGMKNTVIGKIPDNWDVVKIGDFTDVFSGGTPDTSKREYWDGDIPWMNSGDLNHKYIHSVEGRITDKGMASSSTHMIPAQCVLIGLAGQGKTRGTAAINYIPLCTNQSTAALYPSKLFDPLFLMYVMESRYSQLREMSSGEGIRGGLTKALIKDVAVQLPPKDEQKAIAKVIFDFDANMEHLRHLINKEVDLRKSCLDRMFPRVGQIIPDVRIPDFDGEYKCLPAERLFVSYADKGFPELPVLMATQEKGMILRDDSNIEIQHDERNEVTYKRVLPGQFVIHLRSFQGGFAHSNIKGITSPAYTVFGFKDPDEHFDYYWKYLFCSESFINRLATVTYGIRDGRNINYAEFLKLDFYVPTYEEQRSIGLYIQDIDKSIELNKKKLEKYKMIKQGMMEELLTGKVRLV